MGFLRVLFGLILPPTITCERLWPVLCFLLVSYEYSGLKTDDVRYRHLTFDFASLLLLFRANLGLPFS